jgi:hypothetical protein
MEEVAGFSLVEGVGGAGAVVLAILALIGVLPEALAPIAAIAIGVSLLIGGGTIASQYSRFLRRTQPGYADLVRGGLGIEVLCGLAGVALGVLALLGIDPVTLLASAAIVFGGALLMASFTTARVNAFAGAGTVGSSVPHELAREAVSAASGTEVLIGAASVVLGILALANFVPWTLTIVAMLIVGASVMLAGVSIAGRMLEALPRA